MIINPFKRALTYLVSYILAPIVLLIIYVRQKQRKTGPLRILIIPHFTRIGDYICQSVLIPAIRRHMPDAHIAVAVTGSIKGLALYNPHIDEIIVYESESLISYLLTIFRGKYDVSFGLSGTLFSTTAMWLGGIISRYNVSVDKEPLLVRISSWMNTSVTRLKKGEYLPERFLSMLERIGIHENKVEKKVYAAVEGREMIVSLWDTFNIPKESVVIGMSLSAGNRIKEWGDEHFLQLAKKLLKNPRTHIVIIGASSEKSRIERFCTLAGERTHAAVGVALENLPTLLSRFNLFISVDTGPMHIADALTIPLVDIIGPVIYGELTPKGEHVRVVFPDPPVEPTVFAAAPSGDIHLTEKALRETRVEDVLRASKDLLSRFT